MNAEPQMLDVVHRFVEQRGHVVVVKPVDDAATTAITNNQAQIAQQPKLVGDSGLLHPD